jgi:transposase
MTGTAQAETRPTETASGFIAKVRRYTRRRYGAEDKIRIILEGMKREVSTAELCRVEKLSPTIYYHWVKDFMEAGKDRLRGDSKRQANDSEVQELKQENLRLKELLAETTLEKSLLKKSLIGSDLSGISK